MRERVAGLALLAVLAAAPVLAGCSDDASAPGPGGDPGVDPVLADGGEPSDPPGLPEVAGVTVDVEVTPGPEAVAVGYTLTNASPAAVLVPNLLPAPTGLPDEDAQTVYVTGPAPSGAGGREDGDGGDVVEDVDAVLTVSQRVFATPDTDRVDRAQAPRVGVTEVGPGARLAIELSVPLPLERRHPYGNDLGYGEITLPRSAGSLRFCLGVLPAPYPAGLGLERPAGSGGADGIPTIAHGDAAAEAQWLACSDPVRS